MQRLNQIAVGETVEEILRADLLLEEKALDDLGEAIADREVVFADFGSRQICCCTSWKARRSTWISSSADLTSIKQIGVERYILLNAAAAPDQETGA